MRFSRRPTRQRGAALVLELIIFSVAIAIIISIGLNYLSAESRRTAAKATGNQLGQFNTAVRQYYAYHGLGGVVAGTKSGSDWLKSPTCGGEAANPPQGFLPCEFPSATRFGQTFQTDITVNAGVFTAETTLAPFTLSTDAPGTVRNSLAAVAKETAEANFYDNGTQASGVFFAYTLDTNPSSAGFGELTAIATNNYAVADIYLRIDGSNSMQATLNMDTNNVENVNNITGTGSVGFDQDIVAGRDLYAGNSVVAIDDVLSSAGDVKALSGSVVANRDVIATTGGVVAAQNVQSLTGNMVGQDSFVVGTQIDGRYARASAAVYDMRIVPSGAAVTKPVCPYGGTPQIFATPEAYTSGSQARAIHGTYPQVIDFGSYWQTTIYILTSNGWSAVPPRYGRLRVATKCP